jgi:L-threonylcarbamoyladenylate synthase
MIINLNKISKETLLSLKYKIFIYPTDTIYGIGCDATNEKLVEKIREIKERDQKPLSVIAPSKEWILENCIVKKELIDKYLPGPYTLILEKKNKDFLKAASETDKIGVRIPNHEFAKMISELNVPIITTSVNIAGEPFATKIQDIKEKIKEKVDLIIDVGILSGTPSTLIIEGREIKR